MAGGCVPAGEYQLRVVEAAEDTSKSGNDMVKLTLRVIREDGTEGPKLFDYLVMTSDAQWKIDQFLAACEKHPGEGEAIELDTDEMVGWECQAELNVETFKDRKSNKVTNYIIPEF